MSPKTAIGRVVAAYALFAVLPCLAAPEDLVDQRTKGALFKRVSSGTLPSAPVEVRDRRLITAHRFEPAENDVNIAADIPKLLRPIGIVLNLRLGDSQNLLSGRGTGFFVSSCHVMTNAHVLMTEDELKVYRRNNLSIGMADGDRFVDDLLHKIVGRAADRQIRFRIHRDRAGRFIQKKDLEVAGITELIPDVGVDRAVMRLKKCDGVEVGFGTIDVFNEEAVRAWSQANRADPEIALFLAGYAADREQHMLSYSVCDDSRRKGYDLYHFCNEVGGQSGSPLFALRWEKAGRLAYVRKTEARTAGIFNSATMVFVGINKGADSVSAPTRNEGMLIRDPNRLRKKIEAELSLDEVKLAIERAKREFESRKGIRALGT